MNDILNLVSDYGIIIVFVFVLLEYACFPLPSEVVLPLSGAIAYESDINPFIMILICTIAGVIGTLLCYSLGYIGKNKLFNKFTKNKERDESLTFYEKYGNVAISVGRLIPICRTYISFVAGGNKHNIIHYLFFSTIGILIWNTLLIFLGYLFYDNLDYIGLLYKDYKVVVFIIIGLIITLILIKKIKRKHHFSS